MELRTTTPDGVSLALEYHAPPDGAPVRGVVWLGHAILANRRSLDRPRGAGLASEIARAGMHTYNVDLRGHGRSPLPAERRGEWVYDELIRHDFPAVTQLLRERHPGLPIAVVGHSLTGHAAAAWIGTRPEGAPPPVDALVTIAANVWIRRFEPSAAMWLKKLALLGVIFGFTAAVGRVPARALRYGSEDLPAAFSRDWRRWSLTDRWDSRDGVDYLAGLARVPVPVLAILGGGDALLCHPMCGELFHRRLTGAPVEIEVVGAADVGYEPGHMELVTDARSRPLWKRIAGWLARTLETAGAGVAAAAP
jgi:predicted alpha/beta hydrolase